MRIEKRLLDLEHALTPPSQDIADMPDGILLERVRKMIEADPIAFRDGWKRVNGDLPIPPTVEALLCAESK